MVVGITGGIGSGKTTVVNFFKTFKNIAVYLADVEAKKLMQTSTIIKSKLIAEFGVEAYEGNELNRSFIAAIVFCDKKKLANLNSIVHPEVATHFQDFIRKNNKKAYVLYENAILFENGSNKLCDVIISVTAPIKTRIERVLARDKTTKDAVLARINNQWSEEKKTLQSNYLIENDVLEDTKKKINALHTILLKNRKL